MTERFMIVGQDDKSLCHECLKFFRPTLHYHMECERRSIFPRDFPNFAKSDPHAFCSPTCEQDAIDRSRLGRIEFERVIQETA